MMSIINAKYVITAVFYNKTGSHLPQNNKIGAKKPDNMQEHNQSY